MAAVDVVAAACRAVVVAHRLILVDSPTAGVFLKEVFLPPWGTFPFMSLEGNVCFLVVYHYESNTILAVMIANFADNTTLATYQQQLKLLKSKAHEIKVNVIDNQASRVIKKYLTTQQCENLLVEPNNYRVNAAEHANQTGHTS
jgi:hypothetical protein